jgi:hypothetical protein
MVVFVIPAKAEIQQHKPVLDPGDPVPAQAGSRDDGLEDFLRHHQDKVFLHIPKDLRDLFGLRGERMFP